MEYRYNNKKKTKKIKKKTRNVAINREKNNCLVSITTYESNRLKKPA